MRIKLRVPPDVFLAKSREAVTVIASVEGLVWKIWILQQEELEMGGIYLFANRETAEAYLNHPVTQAVRSNPAVVSTESQLWDVESSLSALTRAPLPGVSVHVFKRLDYSWHTTHFHFACAPFVSGQLMGWSAALPSQQVGYKEVTKEAFPCNYTRSALISAKQFFI
jgi:hypothetical protein